MRRLSLLGVVVMLMAGSALVQSAPPANNSVVVGQTAWADTTTISTQHTSTWVLVDSFTVAKTDTCYVVYTAIGTAIMDPGDRLYLGFSDSTVATTTILDTVLLYYPDYMDTTGHVKFGIQRLDSLVSQTDENDVVILRAAVKGSDATEKVKIINLRLSAAVIDKN